METICTRCNTHKINFKGRCPLCDKPSFQQIQYLDLIAALDHITAVLGESQADPNCFYHRFWSRLCDLPQFGNDRYFTYWLSEDPSEETYEDDEKLAEVFGIEYNSVIFQVSW